MSGKKQRSLGSIIGGLTGSRTLDMSIMLTVLGIVLLGIYVVIGWVCEPAAPEKVLDGYLTLAQWVLGVGGGGTAVMGGRHLGLNGGQPSSEEIDLRGEP